MRSLCSRRVVRGALVAAGVAAATPQALAQEIMYGGTARSSGGSVVVVAPDTAAYDTVGAPLEIGPLPAVAMDASGALWVSNNVRNGANEKVGILRRVDPATGAVLETVGTITDARDGEELRITSMEFDPVGGQLFGVSSRGPKEASIFVIDTDTAAATFVGATGLKRGGLAFTPDGRMYLATADDPDGFTNPVIAEIDPSTATVIGTPVELSEGDGIEGLVVRPSDGTFFGNYADGSRLYRIDPTTGEQVVVDRYSGTEGHVADLTFRPSPPVPAADGFLLPQRVKVKINDRRPERSKLKAKAVLDDCCEGLDLTRNLTLHVNDATWDLSGAKVNKKGTKLVFKEGGARVVLRTGLGGSSRGALSVSLEDDLEGLIAPGGELNVRLVGSGLDLSGTAHLEDTRFDLRRGHDVEAPAVVPSSLRGRSRDPGKSSLKATFDLTDGAPMPAEAPDVIIEIGAFQASLAGDTATVKGESFRWRAPDVGVRNLQIDHGKRRITLVLKKVTLGYAGGPLTVRLEIDGETHEMAVLPGVRGASLRY